MTPQESRQLLKSGNIIYGNWSDVCHNSVASTLYSKKEEKKIGKNLG